LFATSARERFSVRQLSLALQDFIEVIVGWMGQYQFNPEAAELRFGPSGDVPPWKLELSAGRALIFTGSVDRVDLLQQKDGTALCVVLDFKSSARKIDDSFSITASRCNCRLTSICSGACTILLPGSACHD
jgi:ATP-dependent helicase/nuclease subunit B